MYMTVYRLDIAFYSHISIDRKYDNMIILVYIDISTDPFYTHTQPVI